MAWRVWRIVEGFLTSMLNSSESGSSAFSGERKKAQVASLATQTKNWGNPHKIEYLFNSWLLRSSHFLWVIFMLLQKLMPKSRNMTKDKTTWKQFHENITERKRQTNALFLDVFRKQFDQFCYIKPLKLDNEIWMCVKWKMEERKRLNTPPQAVCCFMMVTNTCMQHIRHIWTFMHGFPQRRKQTQKTAEQKAFAINHFSVSSVL